MKERIYVCHTYYHVYVTFLKELNLDKSKRGQATLVLSTMSIDFDAVVKALKNINYQGYFTLEADRYLSIYNEENIFDGIKNLAAAAKKLADMYDK